MFKRVFSLFAAFTVLFCCAVPSFATGMTPGGSGGGVAGIPVVGEVQLDIVDFSRYCDDKLRGYGNFIWNLIDDDICSHAPQLGGSHSFVPRRTQVDGQIGVYYVCEYCGRAAGEVLEEAYDEYVETLPGKTLYSDGKFLWQPSVSDLASVTTTVWYASSAHRLYLDGSQRTEIWQASLHAVAYSVPGSFALICAQDNNHYGAYIQDFTFTVPCDGLYQLVSTGFEKSFRSACLTGVTYKLGSSVNSTAVPVQLPWPTFSVEPLQLSSAFSVDSRVSGDVSASGGAGSYGYVQDGQLYQSTVGTIYNETTNVYQNPVTGETESITNWTYDYSDRSYTLTTDEGDTVTVAYGDTNVTINEGGTTYNIYYLAEHDESVPEHYYTSSVTLAPTCTGTGVRTYTCGACGDTYTETIPATGHDYQSSVTLAPTCVNTGVRTYTCTVCGDTYTETIPLVAHDYQSAVTMPPTCINTGVRTFTCTVCGDAYTVSMPSTGHVWQVLQTVPTVYDEGGQLVTEGYTIYQCATCGEQYKITADSGGSSLPSPGDGGTSTDTGASLMELNPHVGRGFLATIAHGLTEDLPEVLKAASAWFTEFPAFYSGFTAFLRDGIAGCLPDIVRKTMGFGLSMVTFVGVVRKIIGR